MPFPYQSKLSGINDPSFHDIVWYARDFQVPAKWVGKRVLLNCGAVDYECRIWVNGQLAGEHRGGHTPFVFDITRLLQAHNNTVVLRVVDTQRLDQLRGKQSWGLEPDGILYMRTTGIWQTVFLEPVGPAHTRVCSPQPEGPGDLTPECFWRRPRGALLSWCVDSRYLGYSSAHHFGAGMFRAMKPTDP